MDYKKLYDIVDSYKEDILKTAKRWVNQPSVGGEAAGENAPFGKDVRAMLDLALKDASDMGFETHDFDGYVMDARMGDKETNMGILAHLDVVPVGEGWTKDPWGGEIENGKIYGRGIADDKGCAVLALYAMKAVREAGIPLSDGVRLVLGCCEETDNKDMHHYAESTKMPDYGFTPDAEFPVINTEKGGMSIRLSAESCGEEGADIEIISLYAGERQNVVPGKAYATVKPANKEKFLADLDAVCKETGFEILCEEGENGCMKLTAVGLAAHASLPHLGKNAAGMLLITLSKLNAGGGINEAVKVLADKLGLEGDGTSMGIAVSDEESGALTCNLGILRFDGKNLSVNLDCRTPICANFEALMGKAAMALYGTPVAIQLIGSRGPHHVSKDHKVVKGLISAYSTVTGKEGYAFAIGGGTYARYMPNTVAFGPVFPGDADLCHMADEYMEIDKMMETCKIMAVAIAELAGKEERKNRSIAVDGPCGAGKSTIAKDVALKLGGHYLDTGAMYRSVGVYMLEHGIDVNDPEAVAVHAPEALVDVQYTENNEQRTILNGEDVTDRLRTPEVSMAASAVSAVKIVRTLMVKRQKELAETMFLVCDGRDIGTCVITDAALKIYLTADAEERARRRYNEMADKSCGFEAVLRDVNQRDWNDMNREESPLRQAEDAVVVDSTHMTIEEVVDEVVRLYRERIA